MLFRSRVGIAARGDFDLSQHERFSGKPLRVFDEDLRAAWAKLDESKQKDLSKRYYDARFGYLVPALVGGLAGTGRVVETPSSLINTPHSWGCRAWFTCLNPFQGFPPRCQPISSVPELALQHPPPGFREIDFPLRCLLFNCIVTAKYWMA